MSHSVTVAWSGRGRRRSENVDDCLARSSWLRVEFRELGRSRGPAFLVALEYFFDPDPEEQLQLLDADRRLHHLLAGQGDVRCPSTR